MTDATTTRLLIWMDRVFRPLFQQSRVGTGTHRSWLDLSFLRLFWSFELLYGTFFDQDTFLADDDWMARLCPETWASAAKSHNLGSMVDAILTILAKLVRLNSR